MRFVALVTQFTANAIGLLAPKIELSCSVSGSVLIEGENRWSLHIAELAVLDLMASLVMALWLVKCKPFCCTPVKLLFSI